MPTKANTERKSNKNLIPAQHKLTLDEQSAGGKKSGEARREKKIIKEEILKRMSEKDWEEMMTNMIQRAKGTDKGFEVFRDSIGQKPAQEVNLVSDAEEFEFKFKYSK